MTSLMLFLCLSLFGIACAHQTVFQKPEDELRAKAYDTHVKLPERPYFEFSVSGVVVGYPKYFRVFYDNAHYDGSGLQITVTATKQGQYFEQLEAANLPLEHRCTEIEIEADHAEIKNCPAPDSKIDYGIYEYLIRAQIPIRGSQLLKTIETVLSVVIREKSPWPLENIPGIWPPTAPNAVANLFEDYQTFGLTPYWHQGLDIRSEAKKSERIAGVCRTSVDGEVVKIVQYGYGLLYWSVMVMDKYGFIWQYHHLDPTTFKVKVGDFVLKGTILGKISYWPVSQNGELYHHMHMNVVRPNLSWFGRDGSLNLPNPYVDGWIYYNPYDLLDHGNFQNDIAPYSDGIMYFLQHGSKKAFTSSLDSAIPQLQGNVDIVLHFASEFNKTNTVPGYPYILGAKKLVWSVNPVEENLSKSNELGFAHIKDRMLFDFHRMGPEWTPCAPKFTIACSNYFLLAIHRERFSYKGKEIQSVFNYNTRKVYYAITNSGPLGYAIGQNEPGDFSGWNTQEVLPSGRFRFPNGLYNITVKAFDWFGNEGIVERTVNVQN